MKLNKLFKSGLSLVLAAATAFTFTAPNVNLIGGTTAEAATVANIDLIDQNDVTMDAGGSAEFALADYAQTVKDAGIIVKTYAKVTVSGKEDLELERLTSGVSSASYTVSNNSVKRYTADFGKATVTSGSQVTINTAVDGSSISGSDNDHWHAVVYDKDASIDGETVYKKTASPLQLASELSKGGAKSKFTFTAPSDVTDESNGDAFTIKVELYSSSDDALVAQDSFTITVGVKTESISYTKEDKTVISDKNPLKLYAKDTKPSSDETTDYDETATVSFTVTNPNDNIGTFVNYEKASEMKKGGTSGTFYAVSPSGLATVSDKNSGSGSTGAGETYTFNLTLSNAKAGSGVLNVITWDGTKGRAINTIEIPFTVIEGTDVITMTATGGLDLATTAGDTVVDATKDNWEDADEITYLTQMGARQCAIETSADEIPEVTHTPDDNQQLDFAVVNASYASDDYTADDVNLTNAKFKHSSDIKKYDVNGILATDEKTINLPCVQFLPTGVGTAKVSGSSKQGKTVKYAIVAEYGLGDGFVANSDNLKAAALEAALSYTNKKCVGNIISETAAAGKISSNGAYGYDGDYYETAIYAAVDSNGNVTPVLNKNTSKNKNGVTVIAAYTSNESDKDGNRTFTGDAKYTIIITTADVPNYTTLSVTDDHGFSKVMSSMTDEEDDATLYLSTKDITSRKLTLESSAGASFITSELTAGSDYVEFANNTLTAKAVGKGTLVITAKNSAETQGTCTLTISIIVSDKNVDNKITVTPTEITLTESAPTATLTASSTYNNAISYTYGKKDSATGEIKVMDDITDIQKIFTLDNGTGTVTYKDKDQKGVGYIVVQGASNSESEAPQEAYVTVNYGGVKDASDLTVASQKVTVYVGNSVSAGASGTGAITYAVDDSAIATVSGDGTITGVKAGTAVVTVKSAETTDRAAGEKTVTVIVKNKKAATIKASKATVKKNAVNKKAQKVTIKVTGSKGKVTVKNATAKKLKKYLKVSGKTVTIKKKAPKGTYKVKVTVAAKGDYKKTTKTITIKVK